MNVDALSAFSRAKTIGCKETIQRVSCLLEHAKLFPSELPRFCPLKGLYESKTFYCSQNGNNVLDYDNSQLKSLAFQVVTITIFLQYAKKNMYFTYKFIGN